VKELSWIGAVVAALAVGCASAPPAQPAQGKAGAEALIGSEWELSDLAGLPVLPDHRPTLSFLEPGRITGTGSCNRYGGAADLGDGTIKVGPLATTRMACSEEIDAQEKAFLTALQNARKVELADGDLVVYTESLERPLRFRRTR
jgi:heat shock protein HslJ